MTKVMGFEPVDDGCLTLAAAPYSGAIHLVAEDGERSGYEPAIAAALADRLGLELRWETMEWPDFYPSLETGKVDAVFYNQAITAERQARVDFSHPYGLFHDAILVRRDSAVRGPADLRGLRVGALVGSCNMAAATAIEGAEVVPYELGGEGFFAMIEDVRSGELEALVDDELPLEELESDGFRVAFTTKTGNPYGIAVAKGSAAGAALSEAIVELLETGELERIWERSLPGHEFEPPRPREEHTAAALRAIVAASVPR